MSPRFRHLSRATLIFALGLWGWHKLELAAQEAPAEKWAAELDSVEERSLRDCKGREIASVVNDEPITCDEVDQRVRLLMASSSRLVSLVEQLQKYPGFELSRVPRRLVGLS